MKPTMRNLMWALVGFVLAIAIVVVAPLVTGDVKIEPGKQPPLKPLIPITGTVPVKKEQTPIVYRAVGSVRSRNEVELAPRIVARITEINVRSGDTVKKNQVLIRLDDSDLAASMAQMKERVISARAGVSGAAERAREAKAGLDLADAELGRAKSLFKDKGVISKAEYERAVSTQSRASAAWSQSVQGQRAASADLAAAEQGLRHSEARLADATIRSPINGVVGERLADPGDLASPGRILLRLFDPKRLLLEVPVRESLVKQVKIGAKASFVVPALDATFEGDVREIVPEVDPQSRTFVVKVCIGESPDLKPGMFGTLLLNLGRQEILVIPAEVVVRTGQTEQVTALVNGRPKRVYVRTVPAGKGKRRVLSGLKEGMKVALPGK